MKKVIIIGAGVSGLSAGIYGQMNGFNTEIFEMHAIPGGECTGWRRKGYYFDGCIHWLLGSKEGTSLNKLWKEVGALGDSVKMIHHDVFYSFEQDEKTVYLYTDIAELKRHFIEIAPQDKKAIVRMCRAVSAMRSMQMPIDKPFDMMKGGDLFKMMLTMLPVTPYMSRYNKITVGEYVERFQSKLLKAAMTMLIPPHYTATALLMTMASLSVRDAGWPVGGSLPFARRIEEKYRSLGGAVHYQSKVKEIIVENGLATGIMLEDGTMHRADVVISAADGHETIFAMLKGDYVSDDIQTMYSDSQSYPVYTTVQVSLGIDCDLSQRDHLRYIEAAHPIDGGGKLNRFVGLKHFCYDKTLVPEGKSVMTTVLQADFSWWKSSYADQAAYQLEKKRIADEVKALAEKAYPEIAGKIEAVDVATPMTYVRYCNAWQGSWMSWANTPKGEIRFLPNELPNLKCFYLAGQWTLPPGGLPTAVATGRWAIQKLCRAEAKAFIVQ